MELKNYGDKAVAEPVPSTATLEVGSTAAIDAGSGHLQRKLNAKQVQLYGIGTAIGTSVFVAMGSYLPTGGPAGLLMAFCIWSCVAFCINETYAEMVCYAPVPAPFVRFCSDWVDQALGFAVSWSFLLTSLFLIPFEITAFHKLIGFWGEFPVAATVFIVMAMYGVLNCVSVRWFGIAEFYLAIGKVVLIFFLFAFVLVTMCGGNPLGDAYGFRYWSDPGAFAEYLVDGVSGRFLGFLSCLTYATFTVCGFEYVSLVAAETKTPRRILPAAYKSYPFRLLFFFCGAALAMGICIPYNDETLNAIMSGEQAGSGTGAASPYVIAMERLKISGLPHFVNAIIMTSVFSAGNG
ncbi:amino acid permease, partial [Hortaea werneckii]